MIRVAFFLIVVGALSLAVAWLADRPGEVVITWQGLRIETSLMVLGTAMLAAMAVVALIWSLIRAILRSPFVLANFLHNRRGVHAYEAMSNGLIAVGSGDIGAARKLSAEVNRLAPGEPLALLLSAQSAQLAGDREGAERAFRLMASRADTKALGLHGLFIEAQRRDDLTSARAYAEEAVRTAPSLGWAGRAVLEFRCATGDWAGALAMLERNRAALDKAGYRRQRAVMLIARALAAEDADRDNAKVFALEAVKLAPTLVPAAALAGCMLAEGGELRRASRIVAKAWRANPHPDLAQTYAELRFGDAARDRLTRIEALTKKTPGHLEGALAIARAALDAREFAKARAALAPYLSAPTKRIALLMAELERAERNDEGRAREWMARALNAAPDPAWTADGYVSDRWLPVSPVSGRLDAFDWRVPLTGIVSTPVIEPEPSAVAPIEPAPERQREKADTPPASAAAAIPSPRRRGRQLKPKPEPVIPLVHAPDDPGPDAVEESAPPAEPQSGGWRKILE
ncbi:MAG: heme biosynthesis HemY N-terminal domain-containing protein [Xanthobacteraceae bacterium]